MVSKVPLADDKKLGVRFFCLQDYPPSTPDWKEKARYMQSQYEDAKETCTAKHDLTIQELRELESMKVPSTKRQMV